MQQVRRSAERGFADHGWLKSFHTFSFADYFDPRHVDFGPLRVINEDRVQPGAGFGTHSHRDMEIISYVLSGALAHKDSMGNGSTIRPGDVQRMSAGRGVQHSEFNASNSEPVHFLQIWIMPSERGIEPGYEERHFSEQERRGQLRLIASSDRAQGSVRVYVHLARGQIIADGVALAGGDALKLSGSDTLVLRDARAAEVLVFDLPGVAAAAGS